jgi:hypothetical protein
MERIFALTVDLGAARTGIELFVKRVAVLPKHFSELADGREPWQIAYPPTKCCSC